MCAYIKKTYVGLWRGACVVGEGLNVTQPLGVEEPLVPINPLPLPEPVVPPPYPLSNGFVVGVTGGGAAVAAAVVAVAVVSGVTEGAAAGCIGGGNSVDSDKLNKLGGSLFTALEEEEEEEECGRGT